MTLQILGWNGYYQLVYPEFSIFSPGWKVICAVADLSFLISLVLLSDRAGDSCEAELLEEPSMGALTSSE